MASTITIKPGQLGKLITADAKAYRMSIKEGVRLASKRVRDYLKSISPVYDGLFKNAWQVLKDSQGFYSVENAAPHAGIIEAGARPHGVSAEGVEAIREWVRKVITRISVDRGPGRGKQGPSQRVSRALTHDEAGGEFAWWVDEVTNAIVHKLATKGQKGKFLVRDNLDKFVRWTGDEINGRIAKYLAEHGGVR